VTLFAEIAGGARPSRPASVREDVAADVERICSIRRGSLLLAPEYGIDDVTFLYHSFPMIDAWSAHLEGTLARYEPRLRQVQVVPVMTESPDLTLRAEIRATLVMGGRPTATRFSATLDAQCRLSVR
jgi:type VI secretion system lysozyme-like protein